MVLLLARPAAAEGSPAAAAQRRHRAHDWVAPACIGWASTLLEDGPGVFSPASTTSRGWQPNAVAMAAHRLAGTLPETLYAAYADTCSVLNSCCAHWPGRSDAPCPEDRSRDALCTGWFTTPPPFQASSINRLTRITACPIHRDIMCAPLPTHIQCATSRMDRRHARKAARLGDACPGQG